MTRKGASVLHPSIERLYEVGREHDDSSPAKVARRLNISIQTLKNWETRGISKDGANKAGRVYECDPLAILDGPLPQTPIAQPIFTKERRASDDVTALQVGLESLIVAVMQRAPGSAKAFLDDVHHIAKEAHFSIEQGFLGGLVEIARGVQSAEEVAAQALQRADSVRRTKRDK